MGVDLNAFHKAAPVRTSVHEQRSEKATTVAVVSVEPLFSFCK